MEKKITRRIVGILVIVALIIILLPLFFTTNEQQPVSQSVEVQPTPAPEVQQATPPPVPPATTAQVPTPAPTPLQTQAQTQVQTQAAEALSSLSETTTPLAQDKINQDTLTLVPQKESTPTNVNQNLTVVPSQPPKMDQLVVPSIDSASEKTPKTETIKLLNEDKASSPTEIFQPSAENNKSTYRSRIKNLETIPADQDVSPSAKEKNDDLITTKPSLNSKKPVWVVQLGSFKNKNNARKLTMLLKTKGYRVFTYESKKTKQTRVCVGPEFKQTKAIALSKQIEHEMKIHGFVVPYNPLET